MKFPECSLLLLLSICFFACDRQQKTEGGVQAKDALATYRVADGFKIEMIASEPLISDPVDMEIDEFGRMYVVEMHGYPLDKSGSGRIILLTDKDGDGTMDGSTVFRDNLLLPTGILRWKNGVIITDAPNVYYLEDADGDGKAEILDTLLTGFALTNPQHNTNNPVYGIDNWIYIAHERAVGTVEYAEEFGDKGSEIRFPGDAAAPTLPVNANGRSIRFQPKTKKLELTSASCQFGQTFDRWGHWFGCNNSNVGYHEVVANRYLERNKGLLVSDVVQNMSEYKGANEVYPITANPDRQLLTDVGVMTSACGITAYLGNEFPEPYNDNVTFIAEPVSNLVRADFYNDTGATFSARRVVEQKEFLASTDAWARPVNCYVGPDGALYVLDYYRQVIESPEWMSKEAIAAGGLYNGSDKGRIFRITPTDMEKADWTKGLNLGKSTTKELVAQLKNKNLWWRSNAQRLIIDRGDDDAVALLESLLNDSSATARLHALWTLEGLGKLSQESIMKGLSDSEGGVRENAIKLAEIHLEKYPGLVSKLYTLGNDPVLKVKFQLFLTLGYIDGTESENVRNNLLFSHINDKWMQIAALTSSSSNNQLLEKVLANYNNNELAYATMAQRLTTMIGSTGTEKEISDLIKKAANQNKITGWQAPVLEGLSQGLKRRSTAITISSRDQQQLVNAFFTTTSDAIRNSAYHVLLVTGLTNSELKNGSLQKALAFAKDSSTSDAQRAASIRFLSLGNAADYSEYLKSFLLSQVSPSVQLAALETLSDVQGTTVSAFLINKWPALTSTVRPAAVQIFVADNDRIKLLLDAIENNKIKAADVSFGTSVRLMMNNDTLLRERARVLFTKDKEDAKRLSKEYQQALDLKGNSVAGREVYMKNCAICHQVRGKSGISFGPDLGTVRNWLKEDILANIIDPNLSISSGYDLWSVELINGDIAEGVIVSETAAAITLRNNGQVDRTIGRPEIKSIKSANISAMPSGLAKDINYQQMADLISFLREN